MKINFLMPIYNGEKKLGKTLESILNQTVHDFTLIIVNDCSTDNTLSLLYEYQKKDNRIKIINLEQNLGIIGALNKGILELDDDCEYIARMDCGDVCHKNRLEKQVLFLDQNEEYMMVGSQFKMFSESGELSEGIIRFQEYSNSIYKYEDIQAHYTVMALFAHPTIMFRRKVFSIVGCYDEKYKAVEDYEIIGRILMNGFKVHKIPRVLVECTFTPNEGISQSNRLIQVKNSLKVKLEYICSLFLKDQTVEGIYIWGTKEFAGFLEEEIRKKKYNFSVIGFTDFDQSTWGKQKNGLPIFSPDQVIKNRRDTDIILTMWNLEREEITRFLNKNGLMFNKDYFVFS